MGKALSTGQMEDATLGSGKQESSTDAGHTLIRKAKRRSENGKTEFAFVG